MIDYFAVISFVFGAIIGSFLTVCIYRIPRGFNFVRPASRCGKCGFPLAFYDNIPVVSFLVLRGRCRNCGVQYGSRHVWIEILTGLTAMYLYQTWGLGFESIFYFLLASVLIVIAWIDIDFQIIPDQFTLLPWAIGIILAGIFELKGVPWFVSFKMSLLSSFGGAFLLWLIAFIYQVLTGVEGLGMGDVKLIGFFGAFFGLQGVWVTIFAGSFLGALWGIVWIIVKGKNKRTPIPFGPFLCLGLVIYILELHRFFIDAFM
ncbi:MAG: prepilin peptidase [Bdellovibrionales bacterium]|nr:prepilin peptidase [Bdellovibrionales bacterium]